MVEALGLSLTEFVFYVINFLILVGLLTKFLYRPFLNMLETRKQSIQDALDNAELINRTHRWQSLLRRWKVVRL